MKKTIITSLLVVTTALFSQTYELDKGWSLLGTDEPISNTDILSNEKKVMFDLQKNILKHFSMNKKSVQ